MSRAGFMLKKKGFQPFDFVEITYHLFQIGLLHIIDVDQDRCRYAAAEILKGVVEEPSLSIHDICRG